MGQKVSPHGLRVGINKSWSSLWYADKKEFAKYLLEDNKIRKFIKKNYYSCAISKIDIDRTDKKIIVNVYTARPGILIGQKGAGVEALKRDIVKLSSADFVSINIKEIKNPDIDAVLIAEGIAGQLEKRVHFRRAMKQAMQRATKAGAKGIKTMVSGRLDGADIARSEHYNIGNLPLHTLRADVDYGTAEADTTFGKVGVKVWVYKGEILSKFAVVPTTSGKGGQK